MSTNPKAPQIDYFNLPNTETAKDCWVFITHKHQLARDDGSTVEMPTSHVYYATSRETGWDLPAEWHVIT